MARTAFFAVGVTAIVAWSWARLEQPRPRLGELMLIAALAVAPALFPRRRLRIAAAVVAALAAASVALEVSPLDARPFDGRHDFVGPLLGRARDGFLGYYDVLVPFNGAEQPLMHGMLLLAVFAFGLAAALAIAARRPVAATLALLLGAGWPATIYPGSGELLRGAVLLAGALALLAGLRVGPSRPTAQALAGGAVLVLALVLSGSGGVAKGQFVDWQNWDFYNKPDVAVGVSYVWRADYDGVRFPNKRTRVLRVRAPARAGYWRATTLDGFTDHHWDEDLLITFPTQISGQPQRADLLSDELLPASARDERNWTKAEVTVEALRDDHLAGASVPVAYEVGALDGVQFAVGGIAITPAGLNRGDKYTVWGHTPRPKPADLARSRPDYPSEIADGGSHLSVERGLSVPPFGSRERAAWLRDLFENDRDLRPYEGLYGEALRIAGQAKNPYAATVALEAWFRSGGGFTYDESPPIARGTPPLVFFVTESKSGYCQHFAGAMALMLRYLGIPARVAAGFTSGTYNRDERAWNVSDRNAHTWVEVWFRGYGWLPFDPTPGRGNLSGPYSASSFSFDAPGAREVLAASALAADSLLRFQLERNRNSATQDLTPRDVRRAEEDGGGSAGFGLVEGVLLAALALAALVVAAKLARRRGRYLTRDPRRRATACRQELVDFLADQGIDVPRSSTLAELRALVHKETGVESRGLVQALGLARFGPLAEASAAARTAHRELRAVRRRLRRALSPGQRLRGAFSLRSLLVGK
jgi:transglutaminase-like putative cysteine protease